jgi:hypothetical protein
MDESIRQFAEEIGHAVAGDVLRQLRKGEVPVAPEYLTAQQAAALTGYTVKALERYRQQAGKGPRFYKVGTSIRYRADDLRSWIEAGGPAQ